MMYAMKNAGISNVDIAVFALYLLGGVGRKVHLEEIAVKCHEMAAGRFAFELQKYKHYPDKRTVFYALADARKEKSGVLVEGFGSRAAGGEKFQITERGVKWMKQNEGRIAPELNVASSIAPKQEVHRILRAVKGEAAFKKFRTGGVADLSVYDLTDFLGCSFETSPSAVRQKFAEMKAKADLVDDAEISAFLRACESEARFANLLDIQGKV